MNRGENPSSVLDLAYTLTSYNGRNNRTKVVVRNLHEALFAVTSSMAVPLLEGEEGGISSIAINRALSDLSDGPSRPLACLMLAEVVVAAVAASHEMTTGEPVSRDVEIDLLNRFIAFGGYAGWNDPLPIVST